MIHVMIAEDMEPIRQRYIRILEADPQIEIVCSTGTGKEAVELVRKNRPDVVLMDIEMESRKAGLTATKQIMEEFPATIILILTVYDTDELLFTAFQYGAKDYILKTADPKEVIESVKQAYNGKPTLRPSVEAKLRSEFRRIREYEKSLLYMLDIISSFTTTEINILIDLHEGKSRKAICASRFIELSTLRTHIHHILKKTNAPNIATLIQDMENMSIFRLLPQYLGDNNP